MADTPEQPKQINFTIVPDDAADGPAPRTYANFCSIAHTPFDFTLTFCEVMPLSEKEIRDAESEHVVRAPVRARIVVPVQFVPHLDRRAAGDTCASSPSRQPGWAAAARSTKGHGRRAASAPRRGRAILDALERQHPDADTELHYRTPFELLVATILSAQSTDARVNMVTPALFARYPDARGAGARPTPAELEPLIHVHRLLPRRNRKSLIGMAQALVDEHGGEVPADMDALTGCRASAARPPTSCSATRSACPGCRSIGTCCASPTASASPRATIRSRSRRSCAQAMPPERWTRASDTLILHGRRICRPKPLCDRCARARRLRLLSRR